MPVNAASLVDLPFLSSLDAESVKRLAAKARLTRVPAGEVILREGAENDALYVVDEGAVQVFAAAFNGTDLVLARLDRGQWFGEQALLGGPTRTTASVRALEDSKLLVISRAALSGVISADHALFARLRADAAARQSFRDFQMQDTLFESVGLSASGSRYKLESFAPGAVIFRAGDAADRVHLILRGHARVTEQGGALELGPGQFFGEMAILDRTPRTSTAVAADELETASLDGEWFRATHASSEKLRSVMDSLRAMYLIPRRGLTTLQTGQVGGNPTQVAVHSLDDGRRVVSMRLVGRDAFTSRVAVDLAGAEKVTFEGAGTYRELDVRDGKVVRIYSEGAWTGLGDMLNRLLDGKAVEPWQIALFRDKGDFRVEEARPLYEGNEVICACTKATCATILDVIKAGCHTLEAVAEKTKATLVCGGCTPLVKELLGKSEWSAAEVVESRELARDVRRFCLRPASGTRPFEPGQHVLLQARIENRWVQRAYTISSAPLGQDTYEITVLREPQGVFTRWLFDRWEPGALLRISEPGGNWYLPASGDVVFLAAGIGMTPALAMMRALVAKPRSMRFHLDYSTSFEDQVVCREELESMTRANPALTAKIRLTRGEGRFDAAALREVLERHPGATFYLCGSMVYVESMQALLKDAGVGPERVKVEVFNAAGEKPKRRPEQGSPSRPGLGLEDFQEPATPMAQAEDIIRRFYTLTGAFGAIDARWRQVETCFRETGTYHATYEELTYAARLAWRNSTRCIGRLYWEALVLRDFRHVSTGAEMLDAIMGHIEMATNKGNIRPVITVFPPKDKDGKSPRVWSPQLFRYAGYRQPDGSCLGDPGNRELTEVAMGLGWKPPAVRTRFDLLPVIVQMTGQSPEWREIPRELVLEVPIEHPRLAWFAELGLKWYALPAVSGMLFNAGGLDYPAAPFNGWYMGTEIGARNFGDVDRYNMLPEVARRMGLDISTERSLWRDQALVELNIAVLHSYDKAGVTMMDHHTASNSFDKFEGIESELGRKVHADWTWIVPPISGSATTAFHRSHWKNVELKPNYYPQPDPWKTDRSWKKS